MIIGDDYPALRRGLGNMKIQSCPTAAAINLKRLAAAFHARFPASGLIRMREMLVSAVSGAMGRAGFAKCAPDSPDSARRTSDRTRRVSRPEIAEGRVVQRPHVVLPQGADAITAPSPAFAKAGDGAE